MKSIAGYVRPGVSAHGPIANREKPRTSIGAILAAASALSIGWCAPALGQDAAPQDRAYVDNGDIIVTARKRQESILEVPVVVTAISEAKLTSTGITNVTELPKLVPGLVIGGSLLSIGPQVTIRGVGTSSLDPGVDQSVSLNIDGLSLGQGLAFGSAMFDVAQVEVLKGPQALFYGKSSPGGVISIRTADPSDEVELIARASYEFEAREKRGELIYSGPLSDTVRGRVGLLYSNADGYFKNRAVAEPGTGAQTPPNSRNPQPRNLVARGTLLWDPSDDVTVRVKFTHAYDRQVNAELKQLADCFGREGIAFSPFPPVPPVPFIGNDNCRYDRVANTVFLDPAAFPGVPNDGVPFLSNKQNFGTLELNWDIAPEISLTSTTAYYKLNSRSMVNPTLTTAAGPTFAVTNRFSREQFTQEFRLNSDFEGPLNFTAGAFYEDGKMRDRVAFIRNQAYFWISPAVLGVDVLNDDRESVVDIETYSLFGQLRYEITDQLELAGGVRWTDESRRLSVFDFQRNLDLSPFLPRPVVGSKTWSPEATITYTPTEDLTVFASYKKGYKSGSFSVAVPAGPIFNAAGQIVGAEDKSFDDERVKGYEIGIKSRLLDRQLLANVAFYDYRYNGLQVGANEPSVGGVPVIRTVNAGSSRTYGVDFDMSFRPQGIEGLSLNGSVNWNKAKYRELTTIPCYYNQTIAAGCNLTPLIPGSNSPPYLTQSLSGTPMIRAPEWAVNFGFDYEMPVASGLKLMLSNNNQYSSKYVTFPATGLPNNANYQSSFFRVDATIGIKAEDDSWEVALIGKNITDKLTASNCSVSNVAGSIFLPFGGDATGTAAQGSGGLPQKLCFADGPGRQVQLRVTFRPF